VNAYLTSHGSTAIVPSTAELKKAPTVAEDEGGEM
jgi:hypothetical protein